MHCFQWRSRLGIFIFLVSKRGSSQRHKSPLKAFITMINNTHTKCGFSGRKNFLSALPANQTQSFPPSLALLRLPPPIPTRASGSLSNHRFCTTHYHLVGRCCSKAVPCNPIIVACPRPEPFPPVSTRLSYSAGPWSHHRPPSQSVPLASCVTFKITLSFFTHPRLCKFLLGSPVSFSSRWFWEAAQTHSSSSSMHDRSLSVCIAA